MNCLRKAESGCFSGGKKTGSRYVLDGSITQLAGSFSIDAVVYDMQKNQHMTFLNNPTTVTS